MQQSGGLLLPPVQKLVATFIFIEGKNGNKPRHPLHKEVVENVDSFFVYASFFLD